MVETSESSWHVPETEAKLFVMDVVDRMWKTGIFSQTGSVTAMESGICGAIMLPATGLVL